MLPPAVRVGDLWWATVPFGERTDGKRRPVVILGWQGLGDEGGDPHILVVPSYTFDKDPLKARTSDRRVKDWNAAGLLEDSFIRCARLWSLAPAAIDFGAGRMGVLDHSELRLVLDEVTKFFAVTGFVHV